MIRNTAVPGGIYTILWSNAFTPSAGDSLPPYCIVDDGRAGSPLTVWLAAYTGGTDVMTINIQRLVGSDLVDILSSDLSLPAGQSVAVYSRNFITPRPSFVVGDFLVPVIRSVNGQQAVTIGLSIQP